MICEFTIKLVECLARPAATRISSRGLWRGLPRLVLWSESDGQTLELRAGRIQPWLPLPVCGSGTPGTFPRPHTYLGCDKASNSVHFEFKLKALSSPWTVRSREQSDRDFMFPSGEAEAKTDEHFLAVFML